LNGEQGDEIMADAKATIVERQEKEKKLTIDLSSVKPDVKLVAAAKAKAEKSKKPKAGLVAKAKPTAQGSHAQH